MEKLLRVLLSLFILAPSAAATLQAQEKPDTGRVAEIGPLVDDILRIKDVNCQYVYAYNEDDQLQIAVIGIKNYLDGSSKKEPVPQVFPNREKAYGACGAWEDRLIAFRHYIVTLKARK